MQEYDGQGTEGSLFMRRYFFHIKCIGDVPERWEHAENDPSVGTSSSIDFEFYWVNYLVEQPNLIGEFGAMLPELKAAG